ncbi:glucose-6-phosphate dehydrogenase assembly protein OpcA [filamentous cyanobacterium LEGE 11480]|uniref:Glucose-6-phosphate dehydrogenase assembly protein OpcA n=1 Tax=Romeriopsis navalis LEGE 11480 TaxID=2777977 RepID=A0A928VSI5_9CYAN|nr:glucose-6-phosphate dehydrogenase assembly protein OpcA [Romeriopsis navalis]MBE9032952.1 glucose-6-phosphate dehydrogenase assembly protein OpcA [Romeriopsis navalis LEGE 11480]
MTTHSAPLVSLQSPKDVSLSQIESELGDIWQSYSNPSVDGSSLAAVRAATFTLVVYEPEETQQLLATLGYYTGPIDGIGGPRTEAAIRAAQETYKLTIDGKSSPQLLEQLRRALAICRGEIIEEGAACSMSSYAMDSEGAGIADAIASQNPCRIISMFPGSHQTDEGVSAQVSAYCPIQKQNKNALVCCEYIMLKGAEQSLERSHGLVKGLLITELPSYVWWKATPNLDQTLFRELGQTCDAVIVDSSQFMADPEGDLQQIHQLLESDIAISDLNWRRLAPWQELAAEAFDSPERWDGLLEVDRVTIDYEKGNDAQALMFLGWIASRPHLEWQPIKRVHEAGDYDIQRITFKSRAGREIEAELAAIPIGDPGIVIGDIVDFRLSSTNLEADCCTILCSEATGCMRMERGTDNCYIQQVSPIADQKAENLLAETLSSWSRDLLYEESLAIAAAIIAIG